MNPWNERVCLQVGTGVATGVAGRLLSDLGVDCVMVEREGDPADLRRQGVGGDRDFGSAFTWLSTGKRSVVIDFLTERGMRELRALYERADIVIRDRFPSDEESQWTAVCGSLPEGLVEVVVSDFGESGPYRDFSADGKALLALAGITFTSGDPDRQPLAPHAPVADFCAGYQAFFIVLARLFGGVVPGAGERFELSRHDVALTLDEYNLLLVEADGLVRKRYFSRQLFDYPSDVVACRDGYVVATGTDFPRLAEMVGQPELATSEFGASHYRAEHWAELEKRLQPWFSARTRETVLAAARDAKAAFTPVLSIDELVVHPHLQARKSVTTVPDPIGGEMHLLGPGFSTALSSPSSRPCPRRGEHGDEWRATPPSPRRLKPSVGRHRPRPLAGLRVLDFSHVWAGPMATAMLLGLGAEVIKVEGPNWIDRVRRTRIMGGDTSGDYWNRAAYFHRRNGGKKSITVDLRREEGRVLIRRLIPQCDVVVDNFSTRVMKAFGFDHAALAALNPRIVSLSLSAFGATGPLAGSSAFGMAMEGTAGLAWGNGYPGGPPRKSGTSFLDPFAGTAAAGILIAALIERDRTGSGQHIDFSMHQAAIAMAAAEAIDWSRTGANPVRMGNRDPDHAPQGCYPCRGDDQWIYLSAQTQAQWESMARILEIDTTSFATTPERLARQDALDAAIGAATKHRSKRDLMAALQRAGVVAAAVMDGEEVLADPHYAARGAFRSICIGDRPLRVQADIAARSDRLPITPAAAAPKLGEHNAEVFGRLLGMDETAIDELRRAGIIGEVPIGDARPAGVPVEQYLRMGSVRRAHAAAGS